MRAAGSLTIVDGQQQRRVVSRSDDGSPRGLVHIDNAAGAPLPGFDPGKLTGVELPEYCHVFSFGFDQPPTMDELVRLATARGFELFHDEPQLRRMQQINERLAALRPSWQRLSGVELSLTALQDRHQQVQVEIESSHRRRSDRLRDLEQEYQRLSQQQREQQHECAELELVARRMEQSIELRRNQLEEVASEAARVRQQWLEQRRQQVAEIDYQLEHWHQVLDLLRRRQDDLQSHLTSWESATTPADASDEAELRTLLRSLGYQVDDVEQDLQELPWTDRTRDERARADYLRSVLGTALHSMRTDVQRLYNELQQQRSATLYHDHARELAHLRRCELELSDLIDVLGRRRQTLVRQDESLVRQDESLVRQDNVAPYYVETIAPSRDRDRYGSELSPNAPYDGENSGETGANGAFRSRLTDPVLQARLHHLLQRRDYLLERIREIDRALEVTQQRLDVLQASRGHLEEDRHLQHLRQDLAAIEEQLRQLDDRQRVREEIESLERELERLRDALQPSQIVQEASAILEAMTDRALRRLRISERQEVRVEDQRGDFVRYTELSRGMRDQVYLSLSLALVAAYRQRGTELPLILNDIFVNIDSERAQSTANVLAQFAGRGHQILLFTRHEHVLQLFPQPRAKWYTLRERGRLPDDVPQRPVSASETMAPSPTRAETYYLDQASAPPAPPHWMPRTEPSPDTAARRPLRRESQYDWVARWDPPRRPAPGRIAREEPTIAEPLGLTPREETALTDVISLDPQAVSGLREIGVLTVGQLLELNPDETERRLARPGITAALIYRWQSEISLQCHAGLSPSDAALLVACGVDDPEELASIDVTELHRRIELFLADAETPAASDRSRALNARDWHAGSTQHGARSTDAIGPVATARGPHRRSRPLKPWPADPLGNATHRRRGASSPRGRRPSSRNRRRCTRSRRRTRRMPEVPPGT